MKFRTTIRRSGKSATGIPIPTEVVEALGAGRKPPVTMKVNGYSYRATVTTVNGEFMVSFSADHRAASGLGGGDGVEVEIELDTAKREIAIPAELDAALDRDPAARAAFDRLSNSNKSFHVLQVTGAKSDETRQRRIEKSIAALREGKPR